MISSIQSNRSFYYQRSPTADHPKLLASSDRTQQSSNNRTIKPAIAPCPPGDRTYKIRNCSETMEVANAGFPEVNPAYEASDRTNRTIKPAIAPCPPGDRTYKIRNCSETMEVANAGFPEVNPAYEASDRTSSS